MGMLKHVTQKTLSAYLDGEARNASRIARHVTECADCASRLDNLRTLSSQVRSLRAGEVHPSFAANVIGRIREAQAEPVRTRTSWLPLAGPVAAAASVALLVATATWYGSQTVEPDTIPVASEQAAVADVADPAAGGRLVMHEIETPYAEASDTAWMFAESFREAPQRSMGFLSEPNVVKATTVEWFATGPVISLAMDDGRDLGTALASLDETAQRNFLMLLTDYARQGEVY